MPTRMQGGMRGRETAQTAEEKQKAEFLREWVDRKLSWTVGLFSGKDRWAIDTYAARINEHGQLVIVDSEFDMEVRLYAAAGIDWHYLTITYWDEGDQDWYEFKPSEEYKSWLAEREAAKAQAGDA